MASETLSFDIVGRDAGASSAFRRVGDTATLAARGARTCAIALEQQRKAADASVGATLTLARADRILADAERNLSGEAARADAALRKAAGGTGGGGGAGGGRGGFFSKLAGGAGPGILGLSPKLLSLVAGGAAGLATLPAATAIGATLGVGGIAAKELIGTKASKGPLFQSFTAAAKSFHEAFATAAKGLEGPLRSVFRQIPGFVKQITPELKQLFAAVGPLLGPVLHAFEGLVKGLLPGLVALLRAARPALSAFASILGTVGKDLGSMFRDFAPVMKQSALIFKALSDVVAGLLPVVGKLAAIFAKALGPVFATLAGVIKSLEPILVIIGKIIAGLAKAVLGDLVSAFGAVGTLIKALSPSFKVLAGVLGSVFKTLENTGVFAILASTLEALAKPLASLVNALIKGLAPILPPIISLVNQVGGIIVQVLAAAVKAVIPLLIVLIKDILKPIIPLIKALAPLIGLLAKGLGLLLVGAIKLVTPLLNIVIKVIGYITTALTAVIKWVISLARNWRGAWSDIKQWAADAWNFLTHGWGQVLVPGLTVIRTVIELVRDHWKAAWNVIKAVAAGAWHVIEATVISPLKAAWHWLQSIWSGLKSVWGWLSGHGGGGNAAGQSAASAQNFARSQLGSHGWNLATQWPPLDALWQRESGWNRLARNPTSGAYGIPQALPPSKMGPAANPPTSSATAQVSWGLGYIKGRYGSPAAAWGHELNFGWYDRGGPLRPGLTLAYNGTGRTEWVGGHGVVIQVGHGGGRNSLDALLMQWLRHNVRVKGGGDVQVAFSGSG